MRADPACAHLARRRLLAGIVATALTASGCGEASPESSSTKPGDGTARPSLKERRIKRLEELQGDPKSK